MTITLRNMAMEKTADLLNGYNDDRLYRALVERDATFEGIFVVAVTTTGIFCRPTCTARKPKREHTRYFASPREALLHGFRPCKVCHPMEPPGAVPDWLKPLMDDIDADPDTPIRSRDLRQRGIDPARVRRWFQRHHGMTFHAYLRSLRIGRAFGRIQEGDTVTEAAFDSGYESISGFGHSFKKGAGFSPVDSKTNQVIAVTRIPTPLGPMLAGATNDGICLLEFADRPMLETQLERIRRKFKASLLPGGSPFFSPLRSQLEHYFAGTLRNFDVPIVTAGTAFQESVWAELQTIPYGETRSYREQATRIGNPAAVRAVARANGDNRIAIIIPCHRVIGSDGTLTGYGGGLPRKRFLLDLERRSVAV